ncbi:MAG: methyltransferase [Candidatus Methanofastidiosia archaeon]|jgi:protein-S-isoprenylcysteine O-methyltransferase Ste14
MKLTKYPTLISKKRVDTMELKDKENREMPHSHVYHAVLPIIFMIVWILDTQILQVSIFLNDIVPSMVRAVLFAVFLGLALLLMGLSHKALFNGGPSPVLITDGIFSHTRNPMYLGILFIYIAFISLSISLISLILFILVFYVYGKMVDYEESILEEIFEDYKEYKKQVPKWIFI